MTDSTKMIHSNKMNGCIQEQYKLCKSLYLIKKETNKRNGIKREQGDDWKNLTYMCIFAKPCHISKLFGPFMKLPLDTTIASLRGHNKNGKCVCVAFHENKLYTGSSYDHNIHIWNTETNKEIACLIGHHGWVDCITLHQNKLYSGGYDQTIRVWNTETHEEIAILRGHTNLVCCLTLHKNKLYSGTYDGTIHVWNTETYEKITTLEKDSLSSCVKSIAIHNDKLYSGTCQHIHVWNIETYKKIAILRGHKKQIHKLTIHENKLHSVELNGTIRIWKV